MKHRQVVCKFMLLFMALIVAIFASGGDCQAGKSPPYEALSQDGSTVVGYARDEDGHSYPIRLNNGTTTDLGTLGGDDATPMPYRQMVRSSLGWLIVPTAAGMPFVGSLVT